MISGAALDGWLGDPERQKASRVASTQLTARWRSHPLFTDFQAELAGIEPKSGPAVLAAVERFMGRTSEISELIREMVAAAAADPFFYPPFLYVNSDINVGFLLFADPSLTVAIGVTDADALAAKKTGTRAPSSINFTGLLSSFHWLKGGGATLSLWEADPADADFVGDPGKKCRFVGRRTLQDGDRFVMDGRRESFVIEHATSDMVCLQATVGADCAPLAVEYDSKTLAFAGASSTDEASSRIQIMIALLRLMDRTDAVPHIAALLDSPHFHTRWHIMRELLALDAEAALPYLREMAENDPHPEVRGAARHTLEMFFPEREEAA